LCVSVLSRWLVPFIGFTSTFDPRLCSGRAPQAIDLIAAYLQSLRITVPLLVTMVQVRYALMCRRKDALHLHALPSFELPPKEMMVRAGVYLGLLAKTHARCLAIQPHCVEDVHAIVKLAGWFRIPTRMVHFCPSRHPLIVGVGSPGKRLPCRVSEIQAFSRLRSLALVFGFTPTVEFYPNNGVIFSNGGHWRMRFDRKVLRDVSLVKIDNLSSVHVVRTVTRDHSSQLDRLCAAHVRVSAPRHRRSCAVVALCPRARFVPSQLWCSVPLPPGQSPRFPVRLRTRWSRR